MLETCKSLSRHAVFCVTAAGPALHTLRSTKASQCLGVLALTVCDSLDCWLIAAAVLQAACSPVTPIAPGDAQLQRATAEGNRPSPQ
jgi:hypothetical protein